MSFFPLMHLSNSRSASLVILKLIVRTLLAKWRAILSPMPYMQRGFMFIFRQKKKGISYSKTAPTGKCTIVLYFLFPCASPSVPRWVLCSQKKAHWFKFRFCGKCEKEKRYWIKHKPLPEIWYITTLILEVFIRPYVGVCENVEHVQVLYVFVCINVAAIERHAAVSLEGLKCHNHPMLVRLALRMLKMSALGNGGDMKVLLKWWGNFDKSSTGTWTVRKTDTSSEAGTFH